MNTKKFMICILLVFLSGCGGAVRADKIPGGGEKLPQATITQLPTNTPKPAPILIEAVLPSATPLPTETLTLTPTSTNIPLTVMGPDVFPMGINPLTGLLVDDPSTLTLPPALVSVANFPITARPQAGLSFSSMVFEMYTGEGMTRFLTMFYGDYPKEAVKNSNASTNLVDTSIGPVRSGRISYEGIRQLYNGFPVMASAYKDVANQLNAFTNIFGSDSEDVNSAMIPVNKLEDIAKSSQQTLGNMALSGMMFDPQLPEGGHEGNKLWLMWSYPNQVFWRYNAETGAYNRWQDDANGETFTLMADRLNDEPLAFENVIILFAQHIAYYPTVIDIKLTYIKKLPALLFRDGKMYEIYWTTISEEYERETGKVRPIRFIDANGNPFALKPGQTWVELLPLDPRVYYETGDSEIFSHMTSVKQPGSGNWVVRFYAPEVVGVH
jgi:hypothetical protein